MCNILSETIANMMDKCFLYYLAVLLGSYMYFSKKCTGNIGVVILILVF